MKRTILIMVCTCLCLSSGAWNRKAHAAIAAIAEAHLTDKAKAGINEIFQGESIVALSYWVRDYNQKALIDFAAESEVSGLNVPPGPAPDCFYILPSMKAQEGNDKVYYRNCLFYIDRFSSQLRKSRKRMSDEEKFMKLAFIVNTMGDIHCPGHLRYRDTMDDAVKKYLSFNVYYLNSGNRQNMHKLMENEFFSTTFPFGPYQTAQWLDTCNEETISQICDGNIFDWGTEVGEKSLMFFMLGEGSRVKGTYLGKDPADCKVDLHICDVRKVVSELIRDAGYRLAWTLNKIFE